MNNKAQVGIGALLIVAITVVVGLVLLQTSAQNTDPSVNTRTLVNGSYTTGAANAYIDLTGQESLSTPVVILGSDGSVINAAGNYSIAEGISATTGKKVIRYQTIGTAFDATVVNISYTYGAEGYMEDSASRSITGLIVILMGLAVAVIALAPVIKSKFD